MTTLSSEYIESERKQYSLYVLHHRAVPSICDGLKASARRVLWTARNGEKTKTATLAGATMPLHPHTPPEDAINTLTAYYGNNIPLFDGYGSFGTLLDPKSYAASRYTSVKVSSFTKEVVFKDINIIPMVDNYDLTLKEPEYFLPLVPVCLINPTEGIAIGFACTILPRSLSDIVECQVKYLQKKKFQEPLPYFKPLISSGIRDEINPNKYYFHSIFEIHKNKVIIKKLPFGLSHSKIIDNLITLIEKGVIQNFTDESSDNIHITILFPKTELLDEEKVIKKLGLVVSQTENLTLLNFENNGVILETVSDIIRTFTDWRLGWYENRYKKLLEELRITIQKLKDIVLAINKNVNRVAKKTKSRTELIEYLDAIGIINLEYIASLPIYRFTEEEKEKTEQELKNCLKTEKEYLEILNNEQLRINIYITELKDVLKKYG